MSNLFSKRLYLFNEMCKDDGDELQAMSVVHVVYCEHITNFDECIDCLYFYEFKDVK